MNSSFIQLENELNLHYFDNQNVGKQVLLFIHGNSSSALTFKEQFTSNLSKSYHLLAIDLPGHGQSDKIPQHYSSGYSAGTFASVLVNFCTQLNITQPILIGHSLGGHVALQSMKELAPLGICLSGTPPLDNPPNLGAAFHLSEDSAQYFSEDYLEVNLKRLFKIGFLTDNKQLESEFLSDFKNTDPKVRSEMLRSVGELNYQSETKLLTESTTPLLVFQGSDEPFVNNDYFVTTGLNTRANTTMFISENGSHFAHAKNVSEFSKQLEIFIEKMALTYKFNGDFLHSNDQFIQE